MGLFEGTRLVQFYLLAMIMSARWGGMGQCLFNVCDVSVKVSV